MRIWHVNVGNHAGKVDGVAVIATQLARDQAALGHDVRLVVAADTDLHEDVRLGAGPEVAVTVAGSARPALREALALLANVETRPDVVHLHSVFRPAHRILAARAGKLGVPVVLSPHSGLAPALLHRDRARKWAYGVAVERHFHRSADGVHALQVVERDDVWRYCGRERPVTVIPNPVDPALLRSRSWSYVVRSARTRPRVVLLCRYDVYQKGLDRVDALARRLPAVDFTVYGHADKNAPERADALIAAAPANMRFEPPVYGEDKLALLRGADLFLQPSRVEGLSVSLVEAMTLGVPCAVSGYVGQSLGLAELGAAVVLHDSPVDAAPAIAELLADGARLASLGAAARAHALAEFDPTAIARRHVDHYWQLVSARPGVTGIAAPMA